MESEVKFGWWNVAAIEVLDNLRQRLGFSVVFSRIDDDIQKEIHKTIADIIRKNAAPCAGKG